MSARSDADVPLFEPADVGLDVTSWDDLTDDDEANRCQDCRRALRSEESRTAGIGPCCAAKLGRAVARGLIRVGPTDRPDDPESASPSEGTDQ